MLLFDYILILLAAVLLSNVVNRFLPALSVPIVQILLGVLIALFLAGRLNIELELEPELFFVLFIAPLVYHSSLTMDKRTFWQQRNPILGAAVILVFLTVIAGGFIMHSLVPMIPLAAAFALVSSLGPTDAVAVHAVEKRVHLPEKIMGVLSGESIINDATGIVCFQFAIAAAITGTFSAGEAVLEFLWMGLGGIAIGLILTGFKYILVKILRSLGMETITLHILIDVLTPFLIFMVAEQIEVSGILAVFAAGLTHSIFKERFNPEKASLNLAEESVWEVLSFSLDGLVFVMLGTQLPHILGTLGEGELPIRPLDVVVDAVLLTLLILGIRFLWWMITTKKRKLKDAAIFGLAGARGTLSLASILSIPLLMPDGNPFPERGLIVLLASGVIIFTLLIGNFILPLLVEQKSKETRNEAEQGAYVEITQRTAARLMAEATDENRVATAMVVSNYSKRTLGAGGRVAARAETKEERKWWIQALEWERENTFSVLADGDVDEDTAKHAIANLNARLKTFSLDKKHGFSWRVMWILAYVLHALKFKKTHHNPEVLALLNAANEGYVLDQLIKARMLENTEILDRIISTYELLEAASIERAEKRRGSARSPEIRSMVDELALKGFQIERELIQEMYETGRISWEMANAMRSNIALLEGGLEVE